jgi:hypothetical protein
VKGGELELAGLTVYVAYENYPARPRPDPCSWLFGIDAMVGLGPLCRERIETHVPGMSELKIVPKSSSKALQLIIEFNAISITSVDDAVQRALEYEDQIRIVKIRLLPCRPFLTRVESGVAV